MKLKLIDATQGDEGRPVLRLANDADVTLVSLDGIERIELSFPKFTDGRAYTQAVLLRQRRRFAGDIRATGQVLVDQLVQMERCGFTSAVLSPEKNPADAPRQFARFERFYQGDAVQALPRFRETA